MERFLHNLELFYSWMRLSVIGLDKRLDVSSFVGSHLTSPHLTSPHLTALTRQGAGGRENGVGGGGGGVLAALWHLVSSPALLEWRVMVWWPSDDHITPTFLTTNLLSINCRGRKGIFILVPFLLCCYEIVFLLPPPPTTIIITNDMAASSSTNKTMMSA